MTQITAKTRDFRVHARHVGAHHARTLKESSFEAAAIAYVEGLHDLPVDGNEIHVIVRDVESGHEHGFLVDLDSGRTATRD
jgi:hypothetical protein